MNTSCRDRVGRIAIGVVLCAALGVVFAGCLSKIHKPADPRALTLTTEDGVTLAATFYAARDVSGPGIVLVHSSGAARASWEPFALRARDAGYSCLAFDLRGHGQSTQKSGQPLSYKEFTTDDWMGVQKDIAAAWDALAANGVDPGNRVVMGVSLGANLALAFAKDRKDVPAVVLVSPGLDYKGVETEKAIAEFGERPSLLVAGKGDTYSASTCATLKKAASGLCEIREYGGSAHGIDLLDLSDVARDEILLWLRPIIGKKLPPLS